MYLTFSSYAEMGGTLTEAEYPRAYHRAEAEFDRRTFDRFRNVEDFPEKGLWCLFELVETIGAGIKLYEASDGHGAITSTSNDGVSESYGSISSASEWQTVVLPSRIAQIVNMYMDNVPVNGINSTYRGVG